MQRLVDTSHLFLVYNASGKVRKRFKGNIMHILRTGHQKEAEEGGGGGDGLQHRHQQQGQPTAQGYNQ